MNENKIFFHTNLYKNKNTKMIENKIDFNIIKLAFKKWTTNTDGYDYAIGGILGEIPWDSELQLLLDWDDVCHRFEDCIGSHIEINLDRILMENKAEIDKLNLWSQEKAIALCALYGEIIDELNNKNKCCMVVEEYSHTDSYGFCKYDIVDKVYGDSIYECICKIWYKYHMDKTNWDYDKFVDGCYNGNVHMFDNLSCHIGNKATNS